MTLSEEDLLGAVAGIIDRATRFQHHLEVAGVHRLGPVERQRRDAVLLFVNDHFVRHFTASSVGSIRERRSGPAGYAAIIACVAGG